LLQGGEADVVRKAGVDIDELAAVPTAETVVSASGRRREDPAPRPTDAVTPQGRLVKKDPNKHYVWVSRSGDPTFGIGSYLASGYKFAEYSRDEAQPMIGWQEFREGDRIESVGSVLMWCPKEHKEMLEREGQKRVDAIEATIKRRDIPADNLTAEERAAFRHIRTESHGDDNRPMWEF
jgi:hypothetical protein